LIYKKVKEIHITRFPYNDFLYQHYEGDLWLPKIFGFFDEILCLTGIRSASIFYSK
jgi:hypothetical protein